MASLKDIKTRIGSVKSTQKITNAMKLVSAAKFARASHAAEAARPYAKALDKIVSKLLAGKAELESPLLRDGEEKKILILMLSPDRGLCGGLNSNMAKAVQAFIRTKTSQGVTQVDLYAGGRRAQLFGKKQNLVMKKQLEKVLEKANVETARTISKDMVDAFVNGGYDRVYVAYPYFKSALDQTPQIDQLLPVPLKQQDKQDGRSADVIVEPGLDELLDKLLERKIVTNLYAALLSALASEHGARMTAMDSATNNAREVIKKLTLQYNRARQAAITKELIEIISGAEALN
ncbi:MAG: ATP synthase F1 subunit gamma [Bdellovibrionota bacterium]|nr:MAG: ATP synthase F1 subunit gamma [Pseudomonadota bacterium]